MTLETRPFDAVRYLETDAALASFIDEAFKIGDPTFIAHAFSVVARTHGMSQIAKEAGLSREGLYKALSETGNPEFATLLHRWIELGNPIFL